MNACLLLAGAKQLLLAGSTFTLSWAPPADTGRWEEDWNVGLSGFQLVETRVYGDGIEPPQGAVLDGDVWRYYPALAFLEDRLVLARPGALAGAWQICEQGECKPIPAADAADAGPAILVPCP
jgi:hypothetical protein